MRQSRALSRACGWTIGGAAWTTPILPRTSRSARVRSERARTPPHRSRRLQRSSGDSARVAAWRLLRFVHLGSHTAVTDWTTDGSVHREAAVSPCQSWSSSKALPSGPSGEAPETAAFVETQQRRPTLGSRRATALIHPGGHLAAREATLLLSSASGSAPVWTLCAREARGAWGSWRVRRVDTGRCGPRLSARKRSVFG
jgi:hypothetical protein